MLALAALTVLQRIVQDTEWRQSDWIFNYVMSIAKVIKLDAMIGRSECNEDAFNSEACQDWATLLSHMNPLAVHFGVNPLPEAYTLSHVSAPASSDPNIPTVLGAVVDDATSLRDLGVDTNS